MIRETAQLLMFRKERGVCRLMASSLAIALLIFILF